jgi:hypothetical protein
VKQAKERRSADTEWAENAAGAGAANPEDVANSVKVDGVNAAANSEDFARCQAADSLGRWGGR